MSQHMSQMRARRAASLWALAVLFLASKRAGVDGFSCQQSPGKAAIQKLHHSYNPNHHHHHRQHQESSFCSPLQVSATPQDEQGLPPPDGGDDQNNNNESNKGVDSIRQGLRRLAQLSLEDYDWRMSVFKEKEANRRVEEYLAGMLGDDASYVRPMDASETKIGPLVSFRYVFVLVT